MVPAMNLVNVIVLALLQGVTELFPVSSLGHTVILPGLLGWGNLLSSDTFLPLVVTLHLGTSVALLTFFWRDWVQLLRGGWRVLAAGKLTPDVDPDGAGRQLMLVVVGTLPAGLVGVLLQKQLESLFSKPLIAAGFLMVNGIVLLVAERLWVAQRRRARDLDITVKRVAISEAAFATQRGAAARAPSGELGLTLNQMTFFQALIIGFSQSFALIPGISRSGITMATGMGNGLSHESAARFSFLMATPIIAAAAMLEVPTLFLHGTQTLLLAIFGGVVAGVAAYASVRFLMRYFETNRLQPFAIYCIGAGALAFGFFGLQALQILPH